MKHYGRRHTLPYLLSLALEYLAYSLRTNAAARRATGKSRDPTSEAERAETKKRANAFWWYLVRGPVWESWTKPRLEGMANALEDKPIIGFAATIVKDYLPLIDDCELCFEPRSSEFITEARIDAHQTTFVSCSCQLSADSRAHLLTWPLSRHILIP